MEQIAPVNSIEICYETFGSPDDPAVLLIRGLGSQMISWRDAFCAALADRGFHIVRFDNRDVGRSTKITPEDFPELDSETPYTLDDMVADTVGLLDHLEIPATHVVGHSLGGMVAQRLAIDHPDRVLSLTSISSHVGGDDAEGPTDEVVALYLEPRPTSREEVIEKSVRDHRVTGSPGFPVDTDDLRDIATRSYDRCFAPDGRTRQIAAIRSVPSRAEALGRLRIPALVVHGTEDPLVPVSNGRRTAAAIPGATFLEIEGMGHDLPRETWPRLIDAIVTAAQRAAPVARR